MATEDRVRRYRFVLQRLSGRHWRKWRWAVEEAWVTGGWRLQGEGTAWTCAQAFGLARRSILYLGGEVDREEWELARLVQVEVVPEKSTPLPPELIVRA